MAAEHEFAFELRVCAWAERSWPPDRERSGSVVVGRQVGTRDRRWDTVVVETSDAALDARATFGSDELDSDLLHVVRHAPADWAWYRDALPDPGYPWRYVRAAVHRAAGRGVVEKRRNGNRIELRRTAPYPDWVDRVVAVENKPDLDASAARALADQLERDVALGLADEVWVATRATGGTVERILLEDLPVEAGVVAFDDDGTADVLWHPAQLAVDAPGTRVTARADGEDRATFEYVDPATQADTRLTLAERVYGRGWRSYVETMRPDCRHFDVAPDGDDYLPHCRAKGRTQTQRECSGNCPEFEPEPPSWRQRGFPLDGGPGATVRRVLERRRERRR